MGGGRPSEGEAGKSIYSFRVNNFYICGKIDSDVSLKVLLAALPLECSLLFPLGDLLFGLAQIYFLFICVLKNMREAESRLGIPLGPAARLSSSPLCTWRRVQRLLQFSDPLKRGVFRVIHCSDALLSGHGKGRC